MSYSNPNRQKYSFLLDHGAGNEVFSFKGPKGKAGRLFDYGVEGVTETYDGSKTLAIGKAGNADAYGEEMTIVATADTTGTFSVRTQYAPDEAGFAALIVDDQLPADTAIYMTAAGGGSGTGIAHNFAIVDWDN